MALQFRRGTAAQRAAAADIPELGEPWFTYDDAQLYVGDGSTPGGVRIGASNPLEDSSNVTLTSENIQTVSEYEITSNIATISCTVNHSYSEGLEIVISGSDASILNGTHTIASITSGASFTIALTNADVTQTSATGTITPMIPDQSVLAWNETEGYWEDVVLTTNIVEDTTPQLGGNLDVNNRDIVSDTNGDIGIAPNGTGSVTIKGNATGGSGHIVLNCEENTHGVTIQGPPHSAAATYSLTLPTSDGDADQVLTTDGSGVLSWTTPVAAIEDLDNVDAAAPSNGEVLVYNSTSTNWEPGTIAGGGTALQHTSFDFYNNGTAPTATIANSVLLGQNYGAWTEVTSAGSVGPSSPTYDPTLLGVTFDPATGIFSGLPQGRYQILASFSFTINNPTPAFGTSLLTAISLSDTALNYSYISELVQTPLLSYASYNSAASAHSESFHLVGVAEDLTSSNNEIKFFLDQNVSPSYYPEFGKLDIVRIGDI